jgi:hypothetical protein
MDDNWKAKFMRKPQMTAEHLTLHIARRIVVVVIQSRFADGENARVRR